MTSALCSFEALAATGASAAAGIAVLAATGAAVVGARTYTYTKFISASIRMHM